MIQYNKFLHETLIFLPALGLSIEYAQGYKMYYTSRDLITLMNKNEFLLIMAFEKNIVFIIKLAGISGVVCIL